MSSTERRITSVPISEPSADPGGDILADDILRKADAGGALYWAIYYHPRAQELIKEFGSSKGFVNALAAAQGAYRVGGR